MFSGLPCLIPWDHAKAGVCGGEILGFVECDSPLVRDILRATVKKSYK